MAIILLVVFSFYSIIFNCQQNQEVYRKGRIAHFLLKNLSYIKLNIIYWNNMYIKQYFNFFYLFIMFLNV